MLDLNAHAKINLYLNITGKRDDGYHLLESLIVFLRLSDRIKVAPAENISLKTSGAFSGRLADGENIILKAAQALKEAAVCKKGAAIELEKNIPVAAGMGGGSADSAAALLALNDLWQLGSSKEELHKIALSLGADVPVCLESKASYVSGVGEKISYTKMPEAFVLLVNPGKPLATAEVFAQGLEQFSEQTEQRDFSSYADLLSFCLAQKNDLETSAINLMPEIGDVLAALKKEKACGLSRMSGSGATCFGLFEKPEDAKKAGEKISAENPGWWVAASSFKA